MDNEILTSWTSFPFDREKATAAAGYIVRFKGRACSRMVLLKLCYLSERRSLATRGAPIAGGTLFSFEHGPLQSEVYDLIKYSGHPWGAILKNEGPRDVRLVEEPDLGSLSENDLAVLDSVLAEFGHWSDTQIYEYVHRELPEYQKPPTPTPILIAPLNLLEHLGWSAERIGATAAELKEQKDFVEWLSR